MAVYKVIQDIEAEDKLLGPLTLKGFVYAAIAGILAFISVRLAISGISVVIKLIFILLFLPPMLLFGTLASPLGREQPTEVWLLSHIRFLLKSKSRKWDQSGTKQLVTITAPKKVERILTKNFSQAEVSSRLQALANTLDSRGWAVKNSTVNLNSQPEYEVEENDNRLSGASTLVEPEQVVDVHPADDILDEENNPTAKNMQDLMDDAEQDRQMAVQERLRAAREAAEEEAKTAPTPQPKLASTTDTSSALTGEEEAILERLHQQENEFKVHPPIIKAGATTIPVTSEEQAVKLNLAQSGSDLSVATIARLVNRSSSGATEGLI